MYTLAMAMTTIKVSSELRDQINQAARNEKLTAGGFIEHLMGNYERSRRLAAFGRAFKTADQTYYDEFALWDVTLADGLDDA